MANDITDIIRFLRADIGDDGATQTYTDTQLITMVAKGVKRLDARIGGAITPSTSGGYIQFEQAVSGSTFLASGTFVLPSGASTSGLPSPLLNLLLLQTECMLAKRSNFDAAGKAIRVRDGDTEIDTSVGFAGLASLVQGGGGPCAEFEKALQDYVDVFGTEIVSNYSTIIWKGTVRKTQTHSQIGVDGDIKTETMPSFSDFLDGNEDGRDNVEYSA